MLGSKVSLFSNYCQTIHIWDGHPQKARAFEARGSFLRRYADASLTQICLKNLLNLSNFGNHFPQLAFDTHAQGHG